MHEAALTAGLIKITLEALEGQNVSAVESVTVSVGVLAGVLPDAMHFAFEAAKVGTVLEGAQLILKDAPARVMCLDCLNEYRGMKPPFVCPLCGGKASRFLSGEEVFVESLQCRLADDN